jgi:hypothetical protein
MNAAHHIFEVPHHVAEWPLQRRPPANQHVIMAGAKGSCRRKPHHLSQAPPHAIAYDRIADLF